MPQKSLLAREEKTENERENEFEYEYDWGTGLRDGLWGAM
jgi:hypothetical protein